MKYSILIPTRERAQTLRYTLMSCLAQNFDGMEIVVSDNFSNDETRDVVESFADERIVYVRPDRRISMSRNFEFSLVNSCGEYVMHIGDDDGLLPDALSWVDSLVRETRCLAVTSSHAVYHWPDSQFENHRNKLTLSRKSGFDVRKSLLECQKCLDFEQTYPALPGTYSSFVSRATLDQVSKGLPYFSSITPDIFSAFANAGIIDEYCFSSRPFAVAGQSGRSNGASQILGKDSREALSFEAENDIATHQGVCYTKSSMSLMTLEAFLQARDRVPRLYTVDLDISKFCRMALRERSPISDRNITDAVGSTALTHGISVRNSSLDGIFKASDKLTRRLAMLKDEYRRYDCNRSDVTDINGACQFAAQILMIN